MVVGSCLAAIGLWLWFTRRDSVFETLASVARATQRLAKTLSRAPRFRFGQQALAAPGAVASLLTGIVVSVVGWVRIPFFLLRFLRRVVALLGAVGTLMIGITLGVFGWDGGLCWELRGFPALYPTRRDGRYRQTCRRFWYLHPNLLEAAVTPWAMLAQVLRNVRRLVTPPRGSCTCNY